MALPTSRNTTYVSGTSQVKAADLNDLQDKIIALNNLITAAAQAVWSGIALAANQHFTVSGTGKYKHGDRAVSIPIYPQNYDGTLDISLPISPATRIWTYAPPAGTRLKSMVVTLIGNGTVDASLTLSKIPSAAPAGSPTTLNAINPTNVPATAGGTEYTLNAGSLPYTLADNEHFNLMISAVSEAAPALRLLAMRAVIDFP